jgi:hypothetical protein
MQDFTLTQIMELNPSLATRKIRVNNETQQGSVIDVIRMISGGTSGKASDIIKTLTSVSSQIAHLRINGRGKMTPVANAATLQMIVHLLPGKQFSSARAKSLVHASTLKRNFFDLLETGKIELMSQQKSIKLELNRASVSDGTCTIEYDYMAGLKPSTLEAMKMADVIFPDDQDALDVPIDAPSPKDGVVYFLRLEGTPMVKVGFSTNLNQRISTLQTACPWQLQLEFITRTPHYAQLEKTIHRALNSSHVRGEWFDLASDFNYCKLLLKHQ